MDAIFLIHALIVTIITMIWCVSGIVLAGFIYGPFFYKSNDPKWMKDHQIRTKCIWTGVIGPIFVLANLLLLYGEDLGDFPKKLYWKSLF